MKDRTQVIVYGLGPIGSAVARLVTKRPKLQLVGGVDIDPAKVGKDIGDVIGLDQPLGVLVVDKMEKVLAHQPADVVLHTTSSYFDLFKNQILEILNAGLDIVSTSEELSFPWLDHSKEAIEIDAAAKSAGKTVLATGVNPGFLMDSLPLMLTAISQQVDHIDVRRVQNASLRRCPFQAKIGSGMTVETFKARMEDGHMGHVGLPESSAMVLDSLSKKMVKYEESVEPVVADRFIKTSCFEIKPGYVRGLKQVARAYDNDGEFLTLTFIAALDNEEAQDTITISGQPNLVITLAGTDGDIATSAIAVNAIRRVIEASSGLLTMRDLPMITIW